MDKTLPRKVEDLNTKDLSKFLEFKNKVNPLLINYPEYNTEFHIFRFFRKDKFKVADAVESIIKFIKFRDKADMDRIRKLNDEDLMIIKHRCGSGQFGLDKLGRPIQIQKVYDTDFKTIMSSENERKRIDYFIQRYERMMFIEFPIASGKAGKRIDKIFLITDLKGLNTGKMLSSKFKGFLQFMKFFSSDCYPEITGRNFIVNVPTLFKGIYNSTQAFVNKRGRNPTITMHSNFPVAKIREFVEIEDLPIFIGGNKEMTIHQNVGPWTSEIKKSKRNQTFFMEDRGLEYKYFYTKEERERIGYTIKEQEEKDKIYNLSEGEKFTETRQLRCSIHLHNKY